jgi:hypothetical protein
MISDEALAELRQHETWTLAGLLADKEAMIQWCLENGYPDEIPDQEQVICVIKSELGARGMFE